MIPLSFVERTTLTLSNLFNGRAINSALVTTMEGWELPGQKGHVLTFSSTFLSGLLAYQTARHVAQGKIGKTIYCLGGVDVHKSPFADRAMQILERKMGIPPADRGEKEGPYMKRVIEYTLQSIDTQADQITVLCEGESLHTQDNIRQARKLRAFDTDTLTFVTHPAMMLRAAATFRAEHLKQAALTPAEGPVIHPLQVWADVFGITPEGWQNNAMARHFVATEAKKVFPPKKGGVAPYVRAGYMLPLSFGDVGRDAGHSLNIRQECARAAANRRR